MLNCDGCEIRERFLVYWLANRFTVQIIKVLVVSGIPASITWCFVNLETRGLATKKGSGTNSAKHPSGHLAIGSLTPFLTLDNALGHSGIFNFPVFPDAAQVPAPFQHAV